jgi:hypothetical protein
VISIDPEVRDGPRTVIAAHPSHRRRTPEEALILAEEMAGDWRGLVDRSTNEVIRWLLGRGA